MKLCNCGIAQLRIALFAAAAISATISPMAAKANAVRVYDVEDYVQKGLVGHFDAIRNKGADLPHDATTLTWKNLVGKYPDATISSGAGAWDEDGKGYTFNGTAGKQAQLDEPGIGLGRTATIQLATTIDPAVQSTGGYYGYFHDTSSDHIAIFAYKATGSTVYHQNLDVASRNSRPSITDWDGKYITAVVKSDSYGIFTGTSMENFADRAIFNDLPTYRYSWGGRAGDNSYSFQGTYHSVRLYNRALTEPELVWNRAIDEQRFREENAPSLDDVNVTLRSNMELGDCVTGYIGKYIVSGTETFVPPSSVTIDGNEWEPAGYILETYDAGNGKWNYASTSSETSYTYDSTGGAVVRVTWNWRLKNGAKKYDADDYVQAGLVVQFDGIRNAGIDAVHDPAATKWVNLRPTADATKLVLNEARPGEWSANGYDFKAGDCFLTEYKLDFGNQVTAQITADYNESLQLTSYPNFFSTAAANADSFTIFAYSTGKSPITRDDYGSAFLNVAATRTSGFTRWDGRILNAAYDKGAMSLTNGLSWAASATGTGNEIGSYVCAIGTGQNSSNNRAARAIYGRIHSVRLYNRVLTEAELRHNMEIDYARFYGTAARSTETDLVEVRVESPGGAVSLDAEGAYLVRGTGSLALSAPATTNIGVCVYTCTGYRAETWNAATRLWENPVETAGTSVALSGTEGAANRRITWLYTLVSGLRTAVDYDIGDYVQKGLVSHYDAIRNLGAGNENHATKTMFWRDSSYRANNLLSCLNSTWSAWTANSHTFTADQYSPMRMEEEVALGPAISIQAVLTSNPASQPKRYPTYFGASSDHGMYGKTTLTWKTDNWFTRVSLANWEGKYINAIAVSGNKTYLSQDATLGKYATDSKGGSCGAERWSVGGSAYEDSNLITRVMTGEYHAARFYNRALTEAELAQNLKVDEIRYRGNFANYANLTVVNRQPEGLEEGESVAGNIADGLYELTGSVTLAAEDVAVGGRTLHPKCRVEEYVDGKWRTVAAGASSPCTVTAGENPLRATWRWVSSGLIISIR
ncbi:MAG: hypothetical protein IKL02_01510 [Kiritimatiellae bacterium]|nr:hypothetical protein [Kiritimatiellia bacterium]